MKQPKAYTISHGAFLALMLALTFSSCGRHRFSDDPVVAESWMGKPRKEWPQLVLTNAASFQDHTPLSGASGFLLQTSDGRILGATAMHLLGANGGVKPKVEVDQLNTALIAWRMFPRTHEEQSVKITGLGCVPPRVAGLDWLILALAKSDAKLPATPLHLRGTPVEIGETVYLVGVPYSDAGSAQNVYKGRVTERHYGDRFRFDIDPPVDIRGFSGAPIIDEKGLVVGVMTIWFEPRMSGARFLEAGGEDAATIFGTVEGKGK